MLPCFYSLGYWLLLYAASFVATSTLFSEILAFLVLSITVWYLSGFRQSAGDRSTSIALAATFMFPSLASPSSTSVVTWGLFVLRRMWPPRLEWSVVRWERGPLLVVALLGVLMMSPVLLTRSSQAYTDGKSGEVGQQAGSTTWWLICRRSPMSISLREGFSLSLIAKSYCRNRFAGKCFFESGA